MAEAEDGAENNPAATAADATCTIDRLPSVGPNTSYYDTALPMLSYCICAP